MKGGRGVLILFMNSSETEVDEGGVGGTARQAWASNRNWVCRGDQDRERRVRVAYLGPSHV